MKKLLAYSFIFILTFSTFSNLSYAVEPIPPTPPPTPAYQKIITSNGTVQAKFYNQPVQFVGTNGMSITGSQSGQTIFFSSSGGGGGNSSGFGWFATNNSPDLTNLHFYNFTAGPGISATVGPDTFTLSAINFVNATSLICGPSFYISAFDNSTGTLTCSFSGNGTILGSQNVGHITGSSGVLSTATSTTIRGKNVTAGHYLQLSANSTDLLLDFTGPNATGQNIGLHGFGPYAGNNNAILKFKNITGGPGISVSANATDITITASGSTDTNTAQGLNIGAGTGKVYAGNNNATQLKLRSFLGGGSVTVTNDTDIVHIVANTFQNNTGQNIGHGGFGPYAGNNVYVLKFKNMTSANSNLVITANTTDVLFTMASSSNNAVIPPAYTVYKLNGFTVAKNGLTGVIDFNSTDSATTIQNALTTASSGRIFIKNGNYTINSSLKPLSSETLEGESLIIPTLVTTCPTCGVTLVENGTTFPLLNITSKQAVIVKNILFNGGKTNSTIKTNTEPLWLKNNQGILLDRVAVANSKTNGIQVNNDIEDIIQNVDIGTSNNDGILLKSTFDSHVLVGKIGSNTGMGIHIQDSSDDEISQVNSYTNNRGFYIHNSYAIRLENNRANGNANEGILVFKSVANPYGNFNIISGNLLLNNGITTPSAQIRLDGSAALPVQNTNVLNNMIIDTQAVKTATYGIRETTLADNNTFTGNTINGTTTAPTLFIGTHDLVRGNMGAPQAENRLAQIMTNYGPPTAATDVQRVNRLGLSPLSISPVCTTSQTYVMQSNGTFICSAVVTSGVTQINTFTGKVNLTGTTGNVTVTNSSGTIKFNTGYNVVVTNGKNQTITKAINFTAGNTLKTLASANRAGFSLGTTAANPTTLNDGDLWINSATITLDARIGGATKQMVDVQTAQSISGAKTFTANEIVSGGGTFDFKNAANTIKLPSLGFIIRNPAESFASSIANSAIYQNNTLTLPNILGTADTFAMLNTTQSFTQQNQFPSSKLLIENPAKTKAANIVLGAVYSNVSATIPKIFGTGDTFGMLNTTGKWTANQTLQNPQINGLDTNYTRYTADHTADYNEDTIVMDVSGASHTLTLPTAVGHTGKLYAITSGTVTTGNVLMIQTTSSQTIDGQFVTGGSLNITNANSTAILQSNGANWISLYSDENTYLDHFQKGSTSRWMGNEVTGVAPTTQISIVSTLRASPLLITHPTVFDKIEAEISTAANPTTTKCRIGIYRDSGNTYPQALVSGSDVGEFADTTAGVKTLTFGTPITLNKGLYWLAYSCATAATTQPTWRALAAGASPAPMIIGVGSGMGAASPMLLVTVAFTYGALPAQFPTGGTFPNVNPAQILLEVTKG